MMAMILAARADLVLTDPYANYVVGYAPGTGISASYTNSSAALGAPTAAALITAPAYLNTEIVGIGNGGHLTVQFDEPIVNDPAQHAYGMDFTIFGNEFFRLSGATIIGLYNHPGLTVWVSQDNHTYYQLVNPGGPTPGANDYYPTAGNGDAALPIDPRLSPNNFIGLTSAQALSLYDGSAGGASYSISWAVAADGTAVKLPAISYIEIRGTSGYGYVDAISRVGVIPEPTSVALLFAGAGLLCFYRRSRANRGERNRPVV
jgi:hypothetical protein